MHEHDESAERITLREATQQYIEALPPAHRGLLQLIAHDYNKPPHALVAGAIEQLILGWTQQVMPEQEDGERQSPLARRSA